MGRVIVSTRSDRAVDLTTPTNDIMKILTHGGAPEGYWGRALDRNWEIEKLVRDGKREIVAARWVDAIILGGYTDAEARGLIADKDVPSDHAGIELWDFAEVPQDRWFRNAWRRSRNGGPIDIDFDIARRAQANAAVSAREDRLRDLRHQLNVDLILSADASAKRRQIDQLERDDLFAPMAAARTIDELRAAWPAVLTTAV